VGRGGASDIAYFDPAIGSIEIRPLSDLRWRSACGKYQHWCVRWPVTLSEDDIWRVIASARQTHKRASLMLFV
jgi:hypothetical protein